MKEYWRTFDNRVVDMEEMDHQHLSNIYYYTHNIVPYFYPDHIRHWILGWLVKRFNGVKLPYRPVPEFMFEKSHLLKMGYLQKNNDIVVNGEKIGCYE